jgi:hypothetical protein
MNVRRIQHVGLSGAMFVLLLGAPPAQGAGSPPRASTARQAAAQHLATQRVLIGAQGAGGSNPAR